MGTLNSTVERKDWDGRKGRGKNCRERLGESRVQMKTDDWTNMKPLSNAISRTYEANRILLEDNRVRPLRILQ